LKNLLLILALFAPAAFAEVCDVNNDYAIDKRDLSLISKSRGQSPGPNDPRDANQDGIISPADIQVCIRLCDLPGCALNP
jgi:hypothetical protein